MRYPELCEAYWFPLYSFVRRSGKSAEDAEDLTQDFFQRVIEKNALSAARSERGKLRTFLLRSMNNFLSDEWDKATAQKRGGDQQIISIDGAVAKERYAMELPDEAAPDKLFERRWVITVLGQVLETLREHYRSQNKETIFEELHQFLAPNAGGEEHSNSKLCSSCGATLPLDLPAKICPRCLLGKVSQIMKPEKSIIPGNFEPPAAQDLELLLPEFSVKLIA